MTGEQIQSFRYDLNRVGHLYLKKSGEMAIEAVEKGVVSKADAVEAIVLCWNMMPALVQELGRLAEDHARMTCTLRKINEGVVNAMQGTARSQIAEDWWQAAQETGG